LSLDKLTSFKFTSHREIIEEVSKKAEKQWGIEKRIKEMEDKIKTVELDIQPYKGTFILKGVEDNQ